MQRSVLYLLFLFFLYPVYGQEDGLPQGDALFGSMRARHIGPALMSGRITDLEGHPTDSKILYAGAAGGGVWKSTDGGVTFTSVFDDHPQSIGAIAVDPQNPDIVAWVGTGECWTRNSVSVGNGLYRTTDGGKNWQHLGLEKSERISSIQINPQNTDEVYVGVLGALWGDSEDRGVYKTTDGGATWEKILYVDAGTGCSDLAIDPRDPKTLYAAFWEFRRTAYSFNSGGYKSALYKTTDGGKTWKKAHNGFPEGKLGRIAIAIAPSSPDILYSVIESEQNAGKGLYRSEDGGGTWQHRNKDFELAVRPFYFSRIVVDPRNPDVVCKAGLSGSISKDGGNTFRTIGSGVHADVHDFWFDIHDSNRIYLGSDGGVYRSWDGGTAWEMVKGLPVSQYYHVTVDMQQPFRVYGGLQDNGSWVGPSASPGGIEARDWQGVGYGDGFRVYPHPEDPNTCYSEMQGAEGLWRVDMKKEQVKTIKPYAEEGDPRLRFNWNTPISTSAHRPGRLFVGSQFLHQSDDRGETWVKISPDLTTNDPAKQLQEESGGISADNSGAENHCTIFTIGESPLDEKVIWVGTDDGNVQVTTDGGRNWANVTANIPGLPKNTWVYHIEPSHFDKQSAYAVFDGHTQNDGNTYVYKTMDGGKTWTSIVTEDIQGFARSIQEDFVNPGLLYLGTEFGLYITVDGGKSWSKFTNNMPAVAVHHVTLHPRDHALVLATHGRGIIIIDDVTPLRQLTPEVAAKDVHFFERPPAIIKEASSLGGTSAFGEFVGDNPTSSARIVYYLRKRHTFGKMEMEILDASGKKIASLAPGKSKGINEVLWNYRYKMPRIAAAKTFTFGGFTTPTVPPGTYTVRMTKGREVYETALELIPDPESIHSQADRDAQHESAMKLYNMNESLAYLIDQVDKMMEGAETAKGKSPSKKVLELLNPFAADLQSMKEELVVTSGDNYVGTAEPMLREKIASLYSAVTGYAGRPSTAQLQNLKLLSSQLEAAQAKMEGMLGRLSRLNAALSAEGLPEITYRSKEEFMEADI
ncbi:MAG: hypothetical protein KDD10_17245 [Phaeodactylibacter sp.]|nr:hypothetical protein [Phaeodactylibacter sp.]MCB9295838.1 hypothetical protein [Lewinellaceae bacterium]